MKFKLVLLVVLSVALSGLSSGGNCHKKFRACVATKCAGLTGHAQSDCKDACLMKLKSCRAGR